MRDMTRLPRVAAIATMPSRLETFRQMLPTIHAQVHHLFVYLDGYEAVPDFLKGLERVSISRAEDAGNLHASSRFLCLGALDRPAVVAMVDDDILYPPDYVTRLVEMLQQVDGQAIVGIHGRVFVPPHKSYMRDAIPFHFANKLDAPCHVHELGTGTCAFVSDRFPVDPRTWDRYDMDDIVVAAEAQRRSLARIALARPLGWLRPLAECQPDSLWAKANKDDSEQSRRMRALLGLYG